MKQVIYGESLQRDPVWYARAQQAMAFLDTLAKPDDEDVRIECQILPTDDGARLLIQLRDGEMASRVSLEPDHFGVNELYVGYMFRLWRQLLRQRRHASIEQLLACAAMDVAE